MAQSIEAEGAEASTTTVRLREQHRIRGIQLDPTVGGSVSIEGYSGLGMLAMDGKRVGHAYYGGLLRATYRYFELGGQLERSDRTKEQWTFVGGFAGAYLPQTNWVDVHATLGIGVRSFDNDDRRYGPSGAKVSVPSLALRLEISDRAPERSLAARIGAALFTQIDLSHQGVPWEYRIREVVISQGVTSFGGVTVGILMSVGLDWAFGARDVANHPKNNR
jgi:hypothetical protein